MIQKHPSIGFKALLFAFRLGFAFFMPKLAVGVEPNYNSPLDKPYTMQEQESLILDREYHRMIRQSPEMSFIFPRPCFSNIDSSRVCGQPHGWAYRDTVLGRRLYISPLVGYEYRYRKEKANSFEGGLRATGGHGPISFYLDARMFTEFHSDTLPPSFDREFVERQDSEASESVDYSSFSRYRSNLNYELSWGRFTIARDAAHWGPGLYGNLVFHQNSIPFNQLTFTTHLGPLTVHSLYGQLITQSDRFSASKPESRSVYAHRYEWRATKNVTLGISEQLLIYGYEEPFAFVPVVPLFVFKGDAWEQVNNGNISFDANWRFSRWARVYGEFLIDDIQSPTALFNDYWGNKWGALIGAQLAGILFGRESGSILEFSRIEPWVYTHYYPQTAQAANQGHPLGNQDGPNSQSIAYRGFIVLPPFTSLSVLAKALWKGEDAGSGLDDMRPNGLERKRFIDGIDHPSLIFGADAAIGIWGGLFSAGITLTPSPQFRLRTAFVW